MNYRPLLLLQTFAISEFHFSGLCLSDFCLFRLILFQASAFSDLPFQAITRLFTDPVGYRLPAFAFQISIFQASAFLALLFRVFHLCRLSMLAAYKHFKLPPFYISNLQALSPRSPPLFRVGLRLPSRSLISL